MDDLNPYVQRLITPEERQALAALIPAYEVALKPAPIDGIRRAIGALSAAFPGQNMTEEQLTMRLKLYVQELSDVPQDVLGAACKDAIRTLTFFPTVAELRKRCKDLYSRQFRLSRIKHLIAKHDREYRAPDPVEDAPMTEQQRKWLDDYYARNGAKAA